METAVVLFLLGVVAAGVLVVRRPEAPATSYWVWAWLCLMGAGAGRLLLADDVRVSVLVAFPLSSAFSVLVLAGALAYAHREVPRWLLPVGAAAGLLRGVFGYVGWPLAAGLPALIFEPIAALIAAWFVAPVAFERHATTAQRLLGPGLVVLAILEAVTGVATLSGGDLPTEVALAWIAVGGFLLGTQFVSQGDRILQALRKANEELEQRVAERTAHLLREIHERSEVQEALHTSEERARSIAELSTDFSFAFRMDPDRNITREWVTGPFEEITGFSPDEIDGRGWLSALDPDDRNAALVPTSLHPGEGHVMELERRIRTKDGRERWLLVRVEAERNREDGCVRIVGAARDITDRKHSEEDRQQLERHMQEVQKLESLGVLAGGIAHDFNNLLTVILGNSRMLLSNLDETSPLHPRASRIRAAAEHAAALVEQMLDYSGKASSQLESIDVSQLAAEMIDLLRASVSEKCRLETELSDDLPPVRGDRTRLRQVLLNLVTNGSEALGGESGSVTVRTGVVDLEDGHLADAWGFSDFEPGTYVFIEVRDTGKGMDAETYDRIFEPYFTTKFSGRGLGLAAVLGIVRAHRGAIKVESRTGQGCTFRVFLPLARGRPAPAAKPAAAPLGSPASGTVLLVDDDVAVLELAREFLERAGFEVIAAVGGAEGLEAFHDHVEEIDAIVLDLAMPDLGGEEALTRIREVSATVPVIVASGFGEDVARARLGVLAPTALLRKPFEPEELIARLREVLD